MTEEVERFWEGLNIENYDWREGGPLPHAFVDLMLLALIRAHPMQMKNKHDELERLRDAKQSIFGIKPKDDRKTLRDIPFLVEMAREYISDRGGSNYNRERNEIEWGAFDESSCRGLKAIARDVYRRFKDEKREFNSLATEDSVAARMARKFDANKHELLAQVTIYGDVEDDFMIEWIKQVRDLFGPFLIPVADLDDPVRDLKYLF